MSISNRFFLIIWTCLAVLAGLGLGALLLGEASPAVADEQAVEGTSEGTPDAASAQVYVPEEFLPRGSLAAAAVTQTLYYAPLDSNNHNTLLFFHNTSAVTATIDLDFQSDTGAPCLSGVVFDLPPGDSARVSADSLDPGRPTSWSNTIIYNMFDTCEIGLISMPNKGVHLAGYVAWTATDTYNPRDLNPHAEIRFSSDPYAIFLPSIPATP
jgi:hypothetical protein